MNYEKPTLLMAEVMIWYYYSFEDHPRLDDSGVMTAVNELLRRGILYELKEPKFTKQTRYDCVQDALDVYVEQILAIPFPTQTWTIKKS